MEALFILTKNASSLRRMLHNTFSYMQLHDCMAYFLDIIVFHLNHVMLHHTTRSSLIAGLRSISLTLAKVSSKPQVFLANVS